MLTPLSKASSHTVLFWVLFRGRCYSQTATAASAFSKPLTSEVKKVEHPYYIPRNSRGSLPVYTDIRNGGTRHLVLIKNVQGNMNVLRDDLASSLFKPESPKANKLRIDAPRSGALVIRGGRWKHDVMDWLRLKGF